MAIKNNIRGGTTMKKNFLIIFLCYLFLFPNFSNAGGLFDFGRSLGKAVRSAVDWSRRAYERTREGTREFSSGFKAGYY